jgi:hypothetical protein
MDERFVWGGRMTIALVMPLPCYNTLNGDGEKRMFTATSQTNRPHTPVFSPKTPRTPK